MRAILVPCLLLSLLVSNARAQNYQGISAYAAMSPRFPCDEWLKLEDNATYPAMAVVWHIFGDDQSCIVKFLDRYKDKPHLLQIHLSGKNCRWEDAPCPYSDAALREMSPATEARIRERFLGLDAMIVQYATAYTRIIISPLLEDDVSETAFRNLTAVVRSNLPYDVARIRWTPGATDIEEFHSNTGRPRRRCLANEDGTPNGLVGSAKFLRRYSKCEAVILWRCDMQGSCGVKKPPARRRYVISNADKRAARLLK